MPSVPPNDVALQGGCFCSAIRYQIDIPPQADRPLVPDALALPQPRNAAADSTNETEDSNNAQPPRYPLLELDHCGSCRRACGSLVQAWIVIPVAWVSFTVTAKLDSSLSNVGPVETPEHVANIQSYPAAQIVKPTADILQQTYLGSYSSNGESWRTFCARCGTGLMFYYSDKDSLDGAIDETAVVMDVALGTLAQECLEQPWLRPQRHSHWESGTAWVKDMMYSGTGRIPRHPRGMPTALIEEDSWMLQQTAK